MTWDLFWDDLSYLPGYVFGGQLGCDFIETGVDIAHETVEAVKILPEMPAMLGKIWETFEKLMKEDRVIEALKTKVGDMDTMDKVKFVVEVASIIPGVSLVQGSIQFGEELGALNVGNEEDFRKKRAEAVMSFISVIPVNKIPALFKKAKAISKALDEFHKAKKLDKLASAAESKVGALQDDLGQLTHNRISLSAEVTRTNDELRGAVKERGEKMKNFDQADIKSQESKRTADIDKGILDLKKQELDENKTQLDGINTQLDSLKVQKKDLEKTRKSVSDSEGKAIFAKKIKEKTKTIKTKKGEKKKLETEKGQLETEKGQLETKYEESKRMADEAENLQKTAKSEVVTAEKNVKNKTEAHRAAIDNYNKNEKKITQINKELDSQKDKADTLRSQATLYKNLADQNRKAIDNAISGIKPHFEGLGGKKAAKDIKAFFTTRPKYEGYGTRIIQADNIQQTAFFEVVGRKDDLKDLEDDKEDEELLLTVKSFSGKAR